ncbi:hypothetical protein ABW21_db0200621 [Orbilia brochopaga]|nr:hypothetical protein ABW21_db0200621 [Drechslerella brochopaga]
MAGLPQLIPRVSSQPLSIDFIDNRLEKHHPAFKRSAGVQYDPKLRRYAPTRLAGPTAAIMSTNNVSSSVPTANPGSNALMPPLDIPVVAKMKFWITIFPEAMEEVKKEPTLNFNVEYAIREKANWDDVLDQLQKARENYDGTKKGFFGKSKRAARKVMDTSLVATQTVSFAKQVKYLSTPMAAVEVLLEAFQRAANVREAAKEMPDQLEHKFGIIEVFLASFPGDKQIRDASIKLVVSVFLAIEKAIEFFLQNQLARGAAALLQGPKYKEELLDRINQIQSASDHLIEVAKLSEVAGSRQAMMALLQGTAKIIEYQDQASAKLAIIDTKLSSIDKVNAFVLNKLNDILDEAVEERKRNEIERRRNEVERKEREKKEKHLWDELEREKRERRIEKEKARAEREMEKAEQKRAREREKTERERERQAYAQHSQKQQDKISSIQNQLVVQQNEIRKLTPSPSHQNATPWQPPPQPPYGLPATGYPGPPPWPPGPYMIPMGQGQAYYAPQPLIYYPQPTYPTAFDQSASNITIDTLLKLLHFPEFDLKDIEEVLSGRDIIPFDEVARAEQVVDTQQFRDWAITAKSTELLVEGNFELPESQYISALSVLCATLTRALRTRERYISLVFFCGCHPEDDDEDEASIAGGVPMIKSLIVQLLKQHSDFDMTGLDRHINQQLVKDDDLDELCALFGWLVKRLPESSTLVCIIDGVVHYEIDAWEDELIKVVGSLLELAKDKDTPLPVKVLITSPTPTESIQEFFDMEDDSSYLTLESLHETNHVPGLPEFEETDESASSGTDDMPDVA